MNLVTQKTSGFATRSLRVESYYRLYHFWHSAKPNDEKTGIVRSMNPTLSFLSFSFFCTAFLLSPLQHHQSKQRSFPLHSLFSLFFAYTPITTECSVLKRAYSHVSVKNQFSAEIDLSVHLDRLAHISFGAACTVRV